MRRDKRWDLLAEAVDISFYESVELSQLPNAKMQQHFELVDDAEPFARVDRDHNAVRVEQCQIAVRVALFVSFLQAFIRPEQKQKMSEKKRSIGVLFFCVWLTAYVEKSFHVAVARVNDRSAEFVESAIVLYRGKATTYPARALEHGQLDCVFEEFIEKISARRSADAATNNCFKSTSTSSRSIVQNKCKINYWISIFTYI